MNYGNKRDDNHGEIRDTLRKIPGCVVHDTADAGGGFPDLAVGFMGKIYLMEIKDGDKPPSKRKLTPDEKKFHKAWSHIDGVVVVNSADEAMEAIGIDTSGSLPF